MNKFWTFAIIFLFTTTHSLTVVAHEAVPGSSGFSHVIGDLGHALGFKALAAVSALHCLLALKREM